MKFSKAHREAPAIPVQCGVYLFSVNGEALGQEYLLLRPLGLDCFHLPQNQCTIIASTYESVGVGDPAESVDTVDVAAIAGGV